MLVPNETSKICTKLAPKLLPLSYGRRTFFKICFSFLAYLLKINFTSLIDSESRKHQNKNKLLIIKFVRARVSMVAEVEKTIFLIPFFLPR